MATNGTHIYYSEDFVNTIQVDEAAAVICHEIWHCILSHGSRLKERDHKLWNLAGDLVINPIVKSHGLKLPKGALFHLNGIHGRNKSTDEVYNELVALRQSDPDALPQPEDFDFDIIEAGVDDAGEPLETTKPANILEAEWSAAVTSATEKAEAIGKLPGGMDNVINALLKPKVNWVKHLHQFMVKDNSKRNYKKFEKRWLYHEMYFAKKDNKRVGDIVVAIDNSGSTSKYREQFASELTYILRKLNPKSIRYIGCDYEINIDNRYTINDLPLATLPDCGDGGTRIEPVFDLVSEADDPPDMLVYLSDMEFSTHLKDPGYPVLWVSCHSYGTAPFGEITFM